MPIFSNKDGNRVSVSLSAQNTFSAALFLQGRGKQEFTAIVEAGTHACTPSLQVSEDNVTWTTFDVNNFGALTNVGAERSGILYGEWYIRIGIETGNYTSGSAIIMMIKRNL